MLSDIVDFSSFATVTFVGHSFLNSAHSLDVCNTAFLVDSHVRGQRSNSMFSKRLREYMVGVPPLSLCVSHFGELTGRWQFQLKKLTYLFLMSRQYC